MAEERKTSKNSPRILKKKETSQSRFQDKIVLVTGGTSGIGLATAIQFAHEGANHIIVCGRTPEKWSSAQDTIKEKKVQKGILEYWKCDVRVEDQVQELIAGIHEKYGWLDICFNNAGVQPVSSGEIEEVEFHSFLEKDGSITFKLPPPGKCLKGQTTPISSYCENPIATTLFGVMYCLKWEVFYAKKFRKEESTLAIVNTTSRMGILPSASRPIYAMAKAAIIQLTKVVATQVAEFGIRVNTIAPGPVKTPLEEAAFPGKKWKLSYNGVPMARAASPEEIAPFVLFLSDWNQSSYVTGSNHLVDGGFSGCPVI